MKLYSLKVNHLTEPVGYAMERVVLSWKTDAVGEIQKAVRILAADEESFQTIIYDSGFTDEIDGIGFELPVSLEPEKRYYWRVIVQTQSGKEISGDSWFETGKRNNPWKAKWITAPFHNSPYICKEFETEKVTTAFLQIIGRGLYEIYVNGQRVGEDYLDPGYSSYDLWEQVQTFHIEPYLKEGKNVIGFILGDGWYRGRLGFDGCYENNYGSELMLKAELHLLTKEKKEVIIGTDESFLCFDSPVIFSNIYDGETYDARKEINDWCTIDCDRSRWIPVNCKNENGIKDQDRLRLPVKKHEVFVPEIITSEKGEIILDFKQNMAGWVEGEIT